MLEMVSSSQNVAKNIKKEKTNVVKNAQDLI